MLGKIKVTRKRGSIDTVSTIPTHRIRLCSKQTTSFLIEHQ